MRLKKLLTSNLKKKGGDRLKKLIIIALLAGTLGCATVPMNVIATNPNTGDKKYISHSSWGWGLAGAMAGLNAEKQQRLAIQAAKEMGYTEIKPVK